MVLLTAVHFSFADDTLKVFQKENIIIWCVFQVDYSHTWYNFLSCFAIINQKQWSKINIEPYDTIIFKLLIGRKKCLVFFTDS